jgi:PTH1 family peptidyl-tRNA hydrolase
VKAIVGLGNPGSEYSGTRHNVGFEVVDELARRWKAKLKKWKSIADVAVVRDRDALLVEPRTYMNSSGSAVQAVMAFYKIPPRDVMIVVDEVQLPLAKIRLRPSGSAGGHNGLKSVIEHVGTDFPRLRIGVERGDRRRDLADRVLSRFESGERDIIDRSIVRAADAVETFIAEGIGPAMNTYNGAEDNQQSEI